MSFGISYGGENVIGSGDVFWYKYPGVNIRFKLIDESLSLPSIAVGADLQGKGRYFDSESRYEIKSPGIFAAVSKNYKLLGYLSLHGTVNYSFEQKDGDGFANFMVGIEKTVGPSVSVMVEYNFGFNDNSNDRYGKGNGYLRRYKMGSRRRIFTRLRFPRSAQQQKMVTLNRRQRHKV
ncbi:MAG: hypothetical protein IPN18_10900 [Ignavibacteriales bacterium]|nr:hypothetical protein [Ignavibacteriales bacterium]